jgi:hypothetical protein
MSIAAEMIARLFTARTAAHMAHFQTLSYAQHKALNEFYDEIVDTTDTWAECYQGIFGLIADYPPVPMPVGKPVDWIETLRQWLKKTRNDACQGETVLENLHDEIMAVCAQTLYKLRFLDNPALCADGDHDGDAPMPAKFAGMMKW